MEMPQGHVIVGRFVSAKQVCYGPNHVKAGQAVPGMYELQLSRDGSDYMLKASFFETEQEGGPTRIASQLAELVESGDVGGKLVAVPVRCQGTLSADGKKAFVNYTATAILALEPVKVKA